MKNIIFEKYQGNGNDFIIIDSRNKNIFKNLINNKLFNIKKLCDRQFGIGSDGLIFILEPEGNNYAKMIIFNSDGTEAQMCGNGIRCLVEYIHKSEIRKDKNFEYKIETKAGIKTARYIDDEITVMMGNPILKNKLIPTEIKTLKNSVPSFNFKEPNFNEQGYAVGMGNPHLIFFLDNLNSFSIKELGPILENNKLFPEKTNVHFSQILDRNNIRVIVWERGVGPTLACGTGACAVHVAAFKLGLCNSETTVNLTGGNLKIKWANNGEEVYMTGNACKVFSGSYHLN